MRRIMNALTELRTIQLERRKKNHPRIQEIQEMFTFVDNALGGVHLNGTGGFDDPETKLQEAMISSDFTFAITEFVQRRMWSPYQERVFDFERLVFLDTTPNFLPVTRYQRRAGVNDLEWVGHKAVARAGSIDDATKRQYQVRIYEKGYDFAFSTLVNDDLGYFNDTGAEMGRSARRTLERFVSRMMNNATTVARLQALGALFFTTGRLTSGRISTSRMGFSQRIDDRNAPIVGSLAYVVHHTGLEDTVRTIQASQLVPDGPGAASNAANVNRSGWIPIEDPHMAGTAPDLPWWGIVDHRSGGIRPFVLARRNGVPAPLIIRKKSDIDIATSITGPGQAAPIMMGDFATGNILLKVHDEWGTYIDSVDGNLVDHRGAFHGTGVAA